MSINGPWHQFMKTVISNLGCGEEGNVIQCKTAQLQYSMAVETAQL